MAVRVAFKTAVESFPRQGNRELPVQLDFTVNAIIQDNLFQEQSQSQIETIQSVYIDNSLNAASLILTLRKTQQVITAQPYSQGVYPVIDSGAIEFQAQTTPGIKILVIFSNTMKNYFVWGPTPGVLIVPPLLNPTVSIAAATPAGDNILVAGQANKTIKVYRLFIVQDADSILTFKSAATLLSGPAAMLANGSITLQPSGIPWFTCGVAENFILNTGSQANIGGMVGYSIS